ncbi:MAG: amine oxidase [Variovorax paradoxus]|uniref:Amine oxidase n=1 Tax=Variovorax paradoxus TaxID=34073 RepID=A0A2W5Q9N6_VARPD|nr:MAG: amine oxidase [Variovorax paradoxus]
MAAAVALIADVAIVGAGLCGLALARTLHARGLQVAVLEARPWPGGRVRTEACEATGQPLDLGAAWLWPDTEPRIAALLDELGLQHFAQHDPGDSLWLIDPNRACERRQEAPGAVHAGAHRMAGGTARLVAALADGLPAGALRTGHAVQVVRDRGATIELLCEGGRSLRARRVVLALPPRLVAERVRFDPPLPLAVQEALAAVPTWMAAQAKALTSHDRAFWRADGHSGNAFVRHPQAVLGEVFDASAPDQDAGALGGFVALDAAQRTHFLRGLPMLVESQLAQLYGPEAQHGRLHLMDWALEPWTCSAADRAGPPEPPQASALLRQPLWAGRLFFGGTETATHGAGHMEGALDAADRLAHRLAPPAAGAPEAGPPPGGREEGIAAFAAAVAALREAAPERYRMHLTRLLSSQQSSQLTQRALLACADQTYSEALARLDVLRPVVQGAVGEGMQDGRHAATAALLAPFEGWNKALLDGALRFNATSCALSNFPEEHRPDAESLRAMTLDLAAAWREFALELNSRLLVGDGMRRAA